MTYVFTVDALAAFFTPRPKTGRCMHHVTQYIHSFSDNSLRLMHSMNRHHWLIVLGLAFALGAYWLRGMGGRKDW